MKAGQFLKPEVLAKLISQWPIVLLTLIAVFPLFADLGGDHLWADEGDTAVLASSILKYGVPKAWDGNTFTDSDLGLRLNKDLVMVSHPWLQYYVTAVSFLFLGETAFAARFPFALAGLLTIPLLYFLVIRLTCDKRAALSAAVLLVLSLQFLLFSRQCRNYALNMFLTCLVVFLFFRLTDRRSCLWFSITAILLFHCNPSGLAPLMALGALSLMRPFAAYRRWFWMAIPFIAVFTLPWIFFAKAGYQENTSMLSDWGKLLPRITQFFIECASVTPAVGVIFLFVWIWWREYRDQKAKCRGKQQFTFAFGQQVSAGLFTSGERTLFITAGTIFFAYAGLISLTQSRSEMFSFGLRHATPIIPLTLALIGILVSKASRANAQVWLVVLILLGVTKVGRITPWSFVDQERTYFDGSVFSAMHVPTGWTNKIFRTGLVSFSRELYHENRGTVAHVCDFLKTNAAPEDILITNYDWEPVYFHTRLRQALKIMPHYPIYNVARSHDLPEYVFTVENTRWLVWRWAWDGYRDYQWEVVYQALVASGARLTKVASVPETTWENRPEVHFHRYPGGEYKYGWFPDSEEPDAEIYRVEWPQKTRGNRAAPHGV